MMRPKFSSFLLMIIFHMISNTIIIADDHVIQKTCKKCKNNDPNIDYNFCISSFEAADSSIDSAVDLRKLGTISLSLIQKNLSNSIGYVEKLLLKKKEVELYEKARLNDCLEVYTDAIVSLEEGTKAYRAKRYEDADIKVSSVMDAARVCEDGFQEKIDGGVSSPLTKRNKDMFQLAAIALSIINMHP